MLLFVKIRLFGIPYTICYIAKESVDKPIESVFKDLGLASGTCQDNPTITDIENTTHSKKHFRLVANALFLHPFLRECLSSEIFRTNLLKNICDLSGNANTGTVCLKLILEPPDQEIIDYAWNERILRLVWSRVEIENAFSWLSTLGGAYSALGDYFENCAEEAGRISQRQYKLSLMLGDEGLAARSKLYSAISSAQKGNLKLARHIVRHVAKFAIQSHDKRLMRMCQGVWVKLKYMRSLKNNPKLGKEDGDKNVHSQVCVK